MGRAGDACLLLLGDVTRAFRRGSGSRCQHRLVGRWAFLPLAPLGAALALAGCGGSSASKSTTAPATSAPAKTAAAPSRAPPSTTAPAKPVASPGALQAEANSAATGDIPDNQVFLIFRNGAAGWSMKYPEGWAQSGSGRQVAFRDK